MTSRITRPSFKAFALAIFVPAVIASTVDCPGLSGSVQVTRNGTFSTGLTQLAGNFAQDARSQCVASNGQRTPAFWTIRLARIASQSMTCTWNVSYVRYEQGPQSLVATRSSTTGMG